MTDTTQSPAPKRGGFTPEMRAKAAATRKANAAKRAAKEAAVAQKPKVETSGEFAGLTEDACAKACSYMGCAISKKPYCAHPRKGGLQGSDMHDRDAIERFNRAKKVLAHLEVDRRD